MSHDNISDIRKVLYGDLNPPPQSSADSRLAYVRRGSLLCVKSV